MEERNRRNATDRSHHVSFEHLFQRQTIQQQQSPDRAGGGFKTNPYIQNRPIQPVVAAQTTKTTPLGSPPVADHSPSLEAITIDRGDIRDVVLGPHQRMRRRRDRYFGCSLSVRGPLLEEDSDDDDDLLYTPGLTKKRKNDPDAAAVRTALNKD